MSSHILKNYIHEHQILIVWTPLFEEELTWQVENTDENMLFVDQIDGSLVGRVSRELSKTLLILS